MGSNPGRFADGPRPKIAKMISMETTRRVDANRYLDVRIDRSFPGSDDLRSTNHRPGCSQLEIEEMGGTPRIFGDCAIWDLAHRTNPTERIFGSWDVHGTTVATSRCDGRCDDLRWRLTRSDDAETVLSRRMEGRSGSARTRSKGGERLDRAIVATSNDRRGSRNVPVVRDVRGGRHEELAVSGRWNGREPPVLRMTCAVVPVPRADGFESAVQDAHEFRRFRLSTSTLGFRSSSCMVSRHPSIAFRVLARTHPSVHAPPNRESSRAQSYPSASSIPRARLRRTCLPATVLSFLSIGLSSVLFLSRTEGHPLLSSSPEGGHSPPLSFSHDSPEKGGIHPTYVPPSLVRAAVCLPPPPTTSSEVRDAAQRVLPQLYVRRRSEGEKRGRTGRTCRRNETRAERDARANAKSAASTDEGLGRRCSWSTGGLVEAVGVESNVGWDERGRRGRRKRLPDTQADDGTQLRAVLTPRWGLPEQCTGVRVMVRRCRWQDVLQATQAVREGTSGSRAEACGRIRSSQQA